MRTIALVLLVAFVALNAAAPASASSTDRSRVNDIMTSAIAADTPGCAVSILSRNAIVYEGARGLADLDYGIPVTSQSIFYIASDSKQFTAFLIGLLADRGTLDLNDRVTKWIPELPAAVYGDVTIEQLVHHTSGVRDYWGLLDLQGIPASTPITQERFLQLMARQQQLNFSPGDRFEYSNSGYALLAVVVARASGKPLPQFAEEEIFKPLGMAHTSFGADHLLPLARRAVGYQFSDDAYRTDPSAIEPLGDGGVRTTVSDLTRWLQNMAHNRLGAHPSAIGRLIRSPGSSKQGSVSYAFGLAIGSRDGYTMYDHTGSYGGYESFVAWIPNAELGIATLCNAENARFSAWSVGLKLIDLYLGVKTASAPSGLAGAPSVELAADQLSRLRGTYTEPDGTVWVISTKPGSIDARVQGLDFRLRASDQSHLIAVDAPQAVQIVIEHDGLTLRVGNGPSERLARFTPPVLTAAQIREYSGYYRSEDLKLTFTVYARNGTLYLDRDLSPAQSLGPVAHDTFTVGPRRLRFVRDTRGAVTGIEFSADGVDALTAAKTTSFGLQNRTYDAEK